MNLQQYANAVYSDLMYVEQKLSAFQDALAGASPNKTSPKNPTEPGLIGNFKDVGFLVQDIKGRLSFLEDILLPNNGPKTTTTIGVAGQSASPRF